MCPIFRFAPAEESSPRAKANLMRGVLTGELPLTTLTSDDFKAVTDLCVNCHMCRLECPASVDIPKLMMEGKGSLRADQRPVDHRLVHVAHRSAELVGQPAVRRWPTGRFANGLARWVMEKVLGIAQGRKLPRFASRSFLRIAARRRLTRPTRRDVAKVLYFVDTYANYHDPQLAKPWWPCWSTTPWRSTSIRASSRRACR